MTMDAKRRQMWLTAGVAAASALTGAGWWRQHAAAEPIPAMASALWSFACPAMGGEQLALRAFQGRPLVVNFWATWCPPCVAEMPLLDAFFRQHSANGWQVVGLAIDQPNAVGSFLAQHPVTYPIGLAGEQGPALMRALDNEGSGLPFTLVMDAQGRFLQKKLGKLIEEDLKSWLNHAS